MSPSLLKSALQLSKAERILLAEQLWDSLASKQDAFDLTLEQEAELDHRLARLKRTGPIGSTWSEAKQRITKRAQ